MRVYHPAVNLFPVLKGQEFSDLCDDIRANGLINPIMLDDKDRVVDGRNRLNTCRKVGIVPQYEKLPEDTDPWSYAWSMNAERRHLPQGVKALAFIRMRKECETSQKERERRKAMANEKRSEAMKGRPHAKKDGERESSRPNGRTHSRDRSQEQRAIEAKEAGVGERTVARAKALDDRCPDFVDKVLAGEMTLNEA